MKVHEYQAKDILKSYGVPVPKGKYVTTPEEARKAAEELGGVVVLKAQVHAGGRGKAGGIKVANSPEEAESAAKALLGARLVTHQTGSDGVPINGLLVEETVDVERELYLAIVVDSSQGLSVMMASESGGMEIEEVAAQSPEKILRAYIDPIMGFQPSQARRLAYGMNVPQPLSRGATDAMIGLWRAYRDKDCSLAEINPLVETKDGRVVALDAKLNFDDNALFRHQDTAALKDIAQEDPVEVEAEANGINNFVKLHGNIGLVVNGAGLAMASMDAVKLFGGEPANFLDIGTVNNTDRVVNAFKILTSDPSVKTIFFNIFGGLSRVDVIAQGIIEAHEKMDIKVPIVARLTGNGVEEGRRLLTEAKIKLIEATDMSDGAKKAVEAAKGG